jgi:hypothetical protein
VNKSKVFRKSVPLQSTTFSMASMIDVSVGGLGSKRGTIGLGEDSVKRFLAGWIWTEKGSFPCSA